MPRYFTQKITQSELAEKIWTAWTKHDEFNWDSYVYYNSLTNQIIKDLSKVNFDVENMSPQGWAEEAVGFHTLENGLTYLGISAGGDWEMPLLFIIYWDGTKLRGYIPTDGNPWNTTTRKAYGNDDIEDEKNMKLKGYKSRDETMHNFDKIKQDIQSRIQFKEK